MNTNGMKEQMFFYASPKLKNENWNPVNHYRCKKLFGECFIDSWTFKGCCYKFKKIESL